MRQHSHNLLSGISSLFAELSTIHGTKQDLKSKKVFIYLNFQLNVVKGL